MNGKNRVVLVTVLKEVADELAVSKAAALTGELDKAVALAMVRHELSSFELVSTRCGDGGDGGDDRRSK